MDSPESREQTTRMLETFASVGCKRFTLTFVNIDRRDFPDELIHLIAQRLVPVDIQQYRRIIQRQPFEDQQQKCASRKAAGCVEARDPRFVWEGGDLALLRRGVDRFIEFEIPAPPGSVCEGDPLRFSK